MVILKMSKRHAPAGTCSIEGCHRPLNSKGLCAGHGRRLRKGESLDVPLRPRRPNGSPPLTCSFEGCEGKVIAAGYCPLHYERFKDGRPLNSPVRSPRTPGAVCVVAGCERSATILDFCGGHYKRHTDGRELAGPIKFQYPRGAVCIFEGCDRPITARGYCHLHDRRTRLQIPMERPLLVQRPVTMAAINILAKERNGVCLSPNYRTDQKLQWQCSKGHVWFASWNHVNSGGHWCPQCSPFKSEGICRAVLELMFGGSFPKSHPRWLRLSERRKGMELDGYNVALGIAFEYQGAQHYDLIPNGYFGGVERLQATQLRDALKRGLCWDNKVALIVIHEIKNTKKLEAILTQIEHAVTWAGLKIPGKWWQRRPTNLSEVWPVGSNPIPDDLHKIAREHGGTCSAPDGYENIKTRLELRCAEGHAWRASGSSLRAGAWCARCYHARRQKKSA
jgi:hypothetical protein